VSSSKIQKTKAKEEKQRRTQQECKACVKKYPQIAKPYTVISVEGLREATVPGRKLPL
jgi:hypothetical protein